MSELPSIHREGSGGQHLSVDFVDIDLAIKTKDTTGKISRQILQRLSGSFESGKLTAVIGPSGCGKSTLMNFLSGRMAGDSIPGSTFSGTVSLNDSIIDPVDYKQRFAYVMAEDAIFATTTPREAFQFVCKLRLPHLTEVERSARAEAMIESLGLVKCADTFVGNALIKGISSGEKKRTAVGTELLTDPDVCFLDEPTTGLDSHSALELIRVVKKIADRGKTVLCVIHQPSSEIFDLFDDVVFMSKGYILYHGSVAGVVPYFASKGYSCPTDYNPADYIMYMLQTIDNDALNKLADAWRQQSAPARAHIIDRQSKAQPLKLKKLRRVSVSTQLEGLISRELKRAIRDPSVLLIRFAIVIFLGLIVGFLFFKSSDPGPLGVISTSHRGGLTNACIFAMFASGQTTLIALPYDRPVILREYANGLYSVTACILARLSVEFPIIFCQNLVLALLIYFLEGFVGNFMLLVLAMFLLGCATASMAIMFGAAFKNVEKAVELGVFLFIPQIMFCGFFVSIDQIPKLFQWAQWLCGLKYAVNIAYIAELTNLPGYEAVFATTGIEHGLLWMYILILVALAVGTTALSIVLLSYRSKSVY